MLLWCRSTAVAPIPPQAWEFPYAIGVALKSKKKKKKNKPKKKGARACICTRMRAVYYGDPLKHLPSTMASCAEI